MIVAEHSQASARAPVFDAAVSGAARDLRSTPRYASTPARTRTHSDEVLDHLLSAMAATSAGGNAPNGRVDVEAFNRALALAFVLPNHVPTPEVVIEDDGEIAFDWHEGPRRVLSVSVGEGPMLSYAALIGPEPTHGRVAFAGRLPAMFAFLLRRIYSAPHADHP